MRDEANLHGNRLRRIETQGNEANKRIELLEEKIRELTEQINSATQRAVRAEEESENLAGELTILEG
ncbi:unnamed protein product [Schistosoma mattheei]|uniref:Uncharacterized protein n=1 Tax=Schistosoma mattheei TaxID=31246 RepID=A0A3P8JEI8_9TREM|nr:unnamed protein product [Schistosoma mattheei]